MSMNLGWIKDCWFSFVTNPSPVIANKDLVAVFWEAGVVFEAFLQKDKNNGRGEVLDLFGLKLNGVQIGLSRDWMEDWLGDQNAKFLERNTKKFGQSFLMQVTGKLLLMLTSQSREEDQIVIQKQIKEMLRPR